VSYFSYLFLYINISTMCTCTICYRKFIPPEIHYTRRNELFGGSLWFLISTCKSVLHLHHNKSMQILQMKINLPVINKLLELYVNLFKYSLVFIFEWWKFTIPTCHSDRAQWLVFVLSTPVSWLDGKKPRAVVLKFLFENSHRVSHPPHSTDDDIIFLITV
jgi:hypothetical protein